MISLIKVQQKCDIKMLTNIYFQAPLNKAYKIITLPAISVYLYSTVTALFAHTEVFIVFNLVTVCV